MSDKTLSDHQIISAIAKLDQRINYAGQNVIQIGLYLEYLIKKIGVATDGQGNLLIPLDLEVEFQEFAKERAAQIDKDVDELRTALQNKQQGINLNDSSGQ